MSATATAIVCGVLIVLVLVWDVWLGTDRLKGNTISEVIWNWSKKSALVPFLFGMLAGHLFWR